MALQLGKGFKGFEGTYSGQMPLLIREGLIPISVSQVMQQRLVVLGDSELESEWWFNEIMTGDGVAYHCARDSVKVVLDASPLRKITPRSTFCYGRLVLSNRDYKALKGIEFSRKEFDKFYNYDAFSSKALMRENPILQALAREQAVLDAYADAVWQKFSPQKLDMLLQNHSSYEISFHQPLMHPFEFFVFVGTCLVDISLSTSPLIGVAPKTRAYAKQPSRKIEDIPSIDSVLSVESECHRQPTQIQQKKVVVKNLGQIVNQLYSDEARAHFVELYKEKGNSVPVEYLEKAIYWYENAGKVDKAASIAKKLNNYTKVAEIYERAGRFEEAISTAEEHNLFSKINYLYAKACSEFKKDRKFEKAAIIAEASGNNELAQQMYMEAMLDYEKRGLFNDAVACADKIGGKERNNLLLRRKSAEKKAKMFDVLAMQLDDGIATEEGAISVYRQLSRIDDAVKVAKKIGLYEIGVDIYNTAERYSDAGRLAEGAVQELRTAKQTKKTRQEIERERRLIKIAISNYEKAKWYDSATTLAEKEGLLQSAIRVNVHAGRYDKAILLALNARLIKQSLEICERARLYKTAEIIAIKNGWRWKKKARLYKTIENILGSEKEDTLLNDMKDTKDSSLKEGIIPLIMAHPVRTSIGGLFFTIISLVGDTLIGYYCSGHFLKQIDNNYINKGIVHDPTVYEFMSPQYKDKVIVIGAGASKSDNIVALDIANFYHIPIKKDNDITNPELYNIIAIGGPYANKITANTMLGDSRGLEDHNLLTLRQNGHAHYILIVAGTTATDTRKAANLLIKNKIVGSF